MVTAVTNDDRGFFDANGPLLFGRLYAAGARAAVLYGHWSYIASGGPPADPSNPSDPAYRWDYLDNQVRLARSSGLEPVVVILDAPGFAEGPGNGPRGTNSPDPEALGAFAAAMAQRYSGADANLPAVHLYQIWSEPNSSFGINPQFENGQPVAVDRYREMVNRAAAAIHAVSPQNRVAAGGTFPFPLSQSNAQAVGSANFLSRLVASHVDFDIWSTHPYTQGNAFHHAFSRDGVSLGDLPRVRAMLTRAASSGLVGHRDPTIPLWITEFGWDSNPPDANGVPADLLRRWTAEALYQAWRSGVNLFTWYQLRDNPMSESEFQGGLYYTCESGPPCDDPKPGLEAFRFPFVAYTQGRRYARIWGRTPDSVRRTVAIEQQVGSRWRLRAMVRTSSAGFFARRVRRAGAGDLRASIPATGDASPAFSPRHLRDRPGTLPFG
jgi:hypothetical protein